MATNPIHQWYLSFTFKADAACLTCQREHLPYTLCQVEFHHIDPDSKCDTLSNMAFVSCVFPDRHTIEPVDFAAEVAKVCTLCTDHHRELHKAADRGDVVILQQRYDFTEPYYVEQIRAFREHALAIAPPDLKERIYAGLWQRLDRYEAHQ